AGHPLMRGAPAAVAAESKAQNSCALPPIRHSSILGAVTEQAQGLTIGQVAERTGLSVHALRFYERGGLLASEVRRTPDGRRAYQQQITAQLAALNACLELITFKVKIYEESLAEGAADPIRAPPSGLPAR